MSSTTTERVGGAEATPTDAAETVRNVYERIAAEYDERIPGVGPADERFMETEMAYLNERIGPNDEVLELGCGTGRFVVEFAPRVRSLTGIDLSPAMLAEAERKATAVGGKPELVEGDMRELPFPDDSFDVVYTMLALMHIPVEDRQQVFDEAARVLKHGGRMLVGVKNQQFERLHEGDRFAAVDVTDVARKQLRFTHTQSGVDLEAPWASFSPDDLARHFAVAGLTFVHLRGNSPLAVWIADSILADIRVRAVVTMLEELIADSPPFNRFGYHLLAEAVKPGRR